MDEEVRSEARWDSGTVLSRSGTVPGAGVLDRGRRSPGRGTLHSGTVFSRSGTVPGAGSARREAGRATGWAGVELDPDGSDAGQARRAPQQRPTSPAGREPKRPETEAVLSGCPKGPSGESRSSPEQQAVPSSDPNPLPGESRSSPRQTRRSTATEPPAGPEPRQPKADAVLSEGRTRLPGGSRPGRPAPGCRQGPAGCRPGVVRGAVSDCDVPWSSRSSSVRRSRCHSPNARRPRGPRRRNAAPPRGGPCAGAGEQGGGVLRVGERLLGGEVTAQHPARHLPQLGIGPGAQGAQRAEQATSPVLVLGDIQQLRLVHLTSVRHANLPLPYASRPSIQQPRRSRESAARPQEASASRIAFAVTAGS